MPPAIVPAALRGHDPTAPVVTLDGLTMGTTWRVLYAAPRGVQPAEVRAAIGARLADLVAQMSHWEPGSALCGFNRAPAGAWVTLPEDFARVMDAGFDLATVTAGTFDPAIGRLVDLWGFGPSGPQPAPNDAAISAVLSRSGYRRLAWDCDCQRLRQPGGVALDFSGIAKGYAADALADLLGARGIRHCLIEVGGELVGRGLRPDGDPWWVELESPPGIPLPPLRVALHQLAVATSGTYRRGAHSLDPRTGRAPTNGVISVSVIADTAMLADALATAITVAFPDLTPLRSLRPAARIIQRTEAAVLEVLTPKLQDLLIL